MTLTPDVAATADASPTPREEAPAGGADLLGLAGTTWYVPPQNLLAYLCDPALQHERPVADQTIWSITSAGEGQFQGTSTTSLWTVAPDGGLTALGTTTNAMSGTVGENGDITIIFTPSDPDQAQTIGYGHLRQVEGAWRMEMQMATGTQLLALHWAYMTRWTNGESMPPAPSHLPDPVLRSDEWRWLAGTEWRAVDEELFPQGAAFTIGSYRNGYFWGDGAVSSGEPLRVAGSVTPEGTLYILFSIAGEPAVARRGAISNETRRMEWMVPAGGPVIGFATLI
ncbi:MAG TPA: hypothetical protein VFS20_20985 [Longimicrobium sp.]|nr:hypothetical protein [Longimicrobium sp.]